ncbi:MAG TPA: TolC family protein [Candidatus Eisenbacteria bacterium]|nr:TolC family protein [Candidatus Eisenbacteria bacterium]
MRKSPGVLLLCFVAGMSCSRAAGQGMPATPAAAPAAQAAAGSKPKALTIQEAEAIGIRNNPQITIGRLRALEAREFVREARSSLMPTATLGVTGVGSRAGSRIAAGYLNNPVIYPRAAAGASVTQLITDFGRTTNLLASSEFQQKAEDANALATQQQIVLAVDEAFYNTLETKSLLQVAQETVDARQLLVDQVQALTKAKLRSDLDLSFSNVDLSRAKLLQLQVRSNYQASLATLSAVLGYSEKQDFEPVEPETQAPLPVDDPSPLIQQALQQRPEVLSLRQQVLSAEKFAHAEHDLWRPSVNAAGVVGVAPVRDDHIDNWYGAAGVNINIPVFNGFLFNARSKSADLQTELQKKKLEDLQNNVARDVRNSWLDTQTAYARLSLTQELRDQTTLALDLAQARYKLGLSSIVEFSQAELQKTDADLQDTDAKYQYRLAQIMLAYQMGEKR